MIRFLNAKPQFEASEFWFYSRVYPALGDERIPTRRFQYLLSLVVKKAVSFLWAGLAMQEFLAFLDVKGASQS